MRRVERIAKGRDVRPHPALNQPFGFTGFNVRLYLHLVRIVGDTVAPNFVPVSNQLFQHGDVNFTPINFPPIIFATPPRVVGRVLIGDQEKCGDEIVPAKDGDGLFELTSQPVVECEGNKG